MCMPTVQPRCDYQEIGRVGDAFVRQWYAFARMFYHMMGEYDLDLHIMAQQHVLFLWKNKNLNGYLSVISYTSTVSGSCYRLE